MNKLKIISFTVLILFVIVFSVIDDNTLLVHAKTISKYRYFGYTSEELFVYKNNTYWYKAFSNKKFSVNEQSTFSERGKVTYNADTLIIAFSNLKLKALLKNNEIEFLDAYKMKLLKNRTSLKNPIYYSGFDDYSFFTSTENKSYDLKNQQIGIIDMILQNKVKSYENVNLHNNQYFKNCKAFLNSKNQIIVDINGEKKHGNTQKNSYEDSVCDGGEGYFNASINLTTHEIIYFSFHGLA